MLNRLEMLRIFCTAAESRNFKEAATRLGVSPQAVTRAVKELEDHVGELLFHRKRQCLANIAGLPGRDFRKTVKRLITGQQANQAHALQ